MLNRMFFAQNVSAPVASVGFGRLYNWYATLNPLLPPAGWRVATRDDWTSLYSLFGGLDQFGASATIGGKLKSINQLHWDNPNTGADDSIGLTIIGAGFRDSNGVFYGLKSYANMWGARPESPTWGYIASNPRQNTAAIQTSGANPNSGYSVRLVKNDDIDPGLLIDGDSNEYMTVKIGSQVWLKENWKCSKYNDGTLIPNVTDSATWASLTTGAMCAYNNDENNV